MCKFQEHLNFWRHRRTSGDTEGQAEGWMERQTLIYRNLLAMAGAPIKHLPTFV